MVKVYRIRENRITSKPDLLQIKVVAIFQKPPDLSLLSPTQVLAK
jgi:hypothetical protein